MIQYYHRNCEGLIVVREETVTTPGKIIRSFRCLRCGAQKSQEEAVPRMAIDLPGNGPSWKVHDGAHDVPGDAQ